MTGKVQEVTMENFESVVDTNPVVILDFWAAWCGPCRIFAPVFGLMAEKHPEVFFGKVNTEVATELAEAFRVKSIPTLMAFKKSELVFEHAGLLPPQAFEELVSKLKTAEVIPS